MEKLEKRLAKPGTYVVLFSPILRGSISIGRLGHLELKEGYYAYVGSAFGPGGLGPRIFRHVTGLRKRRHWHIDYVSPLVKAYEVWYTLDPTSREHEWARILGGWRGASIPLRRFGASDCGCESHLFHFRRRPDIRTFRRKLRRFLPPHGQEPLFKTSYVGSRWPVS